MELVIKVRLQIAQNTGTDLGLENSKTAYGSICFDAFVLRKVQGSSSKGETFMVL